MKLVLKRIGERGETVRGIGGDEVHFHRQALPDQRPFAVCLDGEVPLPRQMSTSLTSSDGGKVLLTVTFLVDGEDVSVEGDPRPAKAHSCSLPTGPLNYCHSISIDQK